MKSICIMAVAALPLAGCLSVKTEHQVKPIEINMNINLKLDKQLEEMVAKEEKPSIRTLMDNGVVGIDNKSMLVPRGNLSSAEFETIFEANSKRPDPGSESTRMYGSPIRRNIEFWSKLTG